MISLDFQNLDKYDYFELYRAIVTGVSTSSPIVGDFEKAIADYLGVDVNCILATNSGTSALHLALIGANIKPEDEVILPVLTFAATANVVKYMGAKIVFCDVDENTWNCTEDTIYDVIYKDGSLKPTISNLKAIIPVDLYGVPCDIFNIEDIVFNLGGAIIGDRTESLGSFYRWGDLIIKNNHGFSCYSFNGNKIITTGAGGLIIGSVDRIQILKGLSVQGKCIERGYYNGLHFDVGYNYRMCGLSAALGLSQLRSIPIFIKRKRRINQIYKAELSHLLQFQKETTGSSSNWWMSAALFPKEINIESIQEKLSHKGIPTRKVFRPINQSKPFADGCSYPVAEYIYEHGLCLPSSTLCTDEDIYKVCKIIKGIL